MQKSFEASGEEMRFGTLIFETSDERKTHV